MKNSRSRSSKPPPRQPPPLSLIPSFPGDRRWRSGATIRAGPTGLPGAGAGRRAHGGPAAGRGRCGSPAARLRSAGRRAGRRCPGPACASQGGREGVRASAAPRRPPVRARSPPGGCHRRPYLASEAPGLCGALRRSGFAAARPAARLCPGEAAGGAAAAAAEQGRARACCRRAPAAGAGGPERGRRPGRCLREVSAGAPSGRCGRGGGRGRRGDGAGESAAGAEASLAAPPPLASLGKFVGPPLCGPPWRVSRVQTCR